MDLKHLRTLELDKILERLSEQTSFSAARALALALRPSTDDEQVQSRQRETAEAKMLLSVRPSLSVGGARDVRPQLRSAEVGAVLEPQSFLDIRSTLASGKSLRRAIMPRADRLASLAAIAKAIRECPKLVAEISQCLNDQGEVVDSASPALARTRRQLTVQRDRMMDRLNRLVTSPRTATYLQEALVTQRSGRYVVPVKAEHKSRIRGIVHDQSASGATLFIEPLAVVELGNRLRQLQLDEQREIERILGELTKAVRDHGNDIESTVQALAQLDLAFAKARYSLDIRAVEPELLTAARPAMQSVATDASGKPAYPVCLQLHQARHPLLPPDTVVPIDIHLGGEFLALVVTGPNTGGKTVALKTVGLLAAMAQCGLQIPAAEGSAMRTFAGIYADIGDEQSIEQSLSTFSSHMTNIVAILSEADPNSLVLLDELGAGTDPTEGSALGRAILTELLQKRVPAMVTTHYTELKLFAQATHGVENASVDFDLKTLSPTFVLRVGQPGRSNAFAIAKRLGLPKDIIERARQWISTEDMEADRILERIRHSRREIGRATNTAQTVLSSARRRERDSQRLLRETEQERHHLLEEARQQLAEAQSELQRICRTSQSRRITDGWLEDSSKRLKQLAEKQSFEPTEGPSGAAQQPLAVGDTVWIAGLSQTGQIMSLTDGEAEVQVGLFRAKVSVLELEQREPLASTEKQGSVRVELAPRPAPTVELNLRGMRAQEAILRLTKYLDDGYLAALPFARVIHGKGTGALRTAVREALAEHPLVASFRPGRTNEGGEGATIVTFVPQSTG